MTEHTGSRGLDVRLERVPYDPLAWEAVLAGYPDAEVFHSAGWLAFLAASQGAEPVIAVVRANGRAVGHFVGAVVRRLGIRILGSPLPGWGTECMGFLGGDALDRRAAAEALVPFAFGELGCLHVDLADRWLTADERPGAGYVIETAETYIVDLQPPEAGVFERMRPRTRQYVRRAARRGMRVEVATEIEFADEFYEQLRAVFGRQCLVPTYGVDRVRDLIRSLQPTGQLLLLRIRSPEGTSLATSISVGRNMTAVSWGAASLHDRAVDHPNEPLWWEMIRYWRERGAVRLDMGGGGEYKAQYGGVRTPTVRIHRSKNASLRLGRAAYRGLVSARQAAHGLWSRRAAPASAGSSAAAGQTPTGQEPDSDAR